MQLIRYNPVRDLFGAEKELDKIFFDGRPVLSTFPEDSTVDMYTEDGKVVTEVALPNFKKEEITVTANDHTLEITAKHQEKKEEDSQRRYVLRESNRAFCRRIALPPGAETDEATASFVDGKLTVTMPLEEDEQPKEVPIT